MIRPPFTLLLLVSALAPLTFGQYIISTIAGGGPPSGVAATSIALSNDQSVAADGAGNLYVVPSFQNRVFKVATNGILTTVAGTGAPGYSGDNGAATSAQLNNPVGVAVDSNGNLYIADGGNYRVRKVTGGVITTVAGTGISGYSGDNGPATSAQISYATTVAADDSGNFYIADNYRIRKVAGGVITTVAGNGTSGYSGDNGPATSAQIGYAGGLAADNSGNLYIADSFNYRVRRVAGGVITTVAGNGTTGYSGDGGLATSAQLSHPQGVAVDSSGNLYIADSFNYRVRRVAGGVITTVAGNGSYGYSGDGGLATSAQLSFPQGVAAGSAGTFYIADTVNYRVRKVESGVISTIVGNGSYQYSGDNGPATIAQVSPQGVAVQSAGNFYIADASDYRIRNVSGGVITTVAGNGTLGYSGDGGPATNAQIGYSPGVAAGSGNLYIADPNNNRIRRVSGGTITTVAGNGTSGFSGDNGPATSAQLANPGAVAADNNGNVYIADNNRIRKVSGGVITTVAGGGPTNGASATSVSLHTIFAVASDASGNLYIPSANDNRVYKVSTGGTITTVAGTGSAGFSGDNGLATDAQLNYPSGVAVNGAGTVVYIADKGNNRIRKVTGGVITTVAGNGIYDYSGDGGPATSASLRSPTSVAVDGSDNLYVADALNYRARVVSGGVINTVAGNGTCCYSGDNGLATSAQINYSTAITVDGSGNLYIGDSENFRVRKVSSGVISTVAGNGSYGDSGDGGPATSAQLSYAYGVAVDGAGNLFIADAANSRIRKVASGVITTVAGTGVSGYSGDNGSATSAQISYPYYVAVDSQNNLYIADTNNYRVRKVSGGVITTVAGNGSNSYSGDGGQATNAQLNSPSGLAVDNAGNVYIADTSNYRIRQVSPSGLISTVAGNGSYGFSGDGGLATSASLASGQGLAVDGAGNLYIAEQNSNRIRRVSGGLITTIAGTGFNGFSGDGGPAINASLNNPQGLAVDSAGKIYIADFGNSRVRLLTPASVLSITKTHSQNFTQGQQNAQYTVTVSNGPGSLPTDGTTVTVTETVPTGMTLVSMSGINWTCPVGGHTCTRNSVLAANASYEPITVTVSVAGNANSPLINHVDVAGGGSLPASADNTTIILPASNAQPVSVVPSSGSAGRQSFTFVARHASGANNIQYTQFLFTKSGISALNACYISYDPTGNVFYLLSDDLSQWYGLLGGSANTIGNAQCTIYGATSGSTKSGTDLTTTVDISFRSGFAGLKTIYQFSGDTLGSGSGWISMGTWNDTGDLSAVELISFTPSSGNGASQTFTAVVRDGDGANTIAFAQLVMNAGLSGFNGCFIHYDRASNVFYLLNDVGTVFSGLVAGTAGQVSNSQCTLHGTGSGGVVAGSNLTITYNLDFSAGFAGAKQTFMQAVDNTGIIEVWHRVGTWTR